MVEVRIADSHFLRPDIDSRGWRPHSRYKVCPVCLLHWCTITVGKGPPYSVEGQNCTMCPSLNPSIYGVPIPGSLLEDIGSQTVDWDLLDFLPLDLVRRELLLTIEAFTRDYRSNNPPVPTGS